MTAAEMAGWPTRINPATGRSVVRPYVNGRDLTAASRQACVIDFFMQDQADAARLHPQAFQRVLDRVKPERDVNRRPSIRDKWWRFGWERPVWREAARLLPRFISTPETAKHRFFVFLDAETLPDNMLTNFAVGDAFCLGVMSSSIHVCWALARGGTLEDRPRYNKTVCFDPFPFPDCTDAQMVRIRQLGEDLDAHRKRQQAAHPGLTLPGLYNVLAKLRTGEPLSEKEKSIHEQGLASILKKIHDELDAAVFDAYGWPSDLTDEQILEHLVKLNGERAEEEKNGLVRWLRPEFQNPQGKGPAAQVEIEDAEAPEEEAAAPAAATVPWPKKLPGQIAAVRDLLLRETSSWTAGQVGARFKGARGKDVQTALDSLAALGLLVSFDSPQGLRYQAGGRPAA